MTEMAITEFIEIDPDELHLVGKGANGFRALLAKSASDEVRAVLEDITDVINKADDETKCATCKGTGKIMQGNRKCPKCLGTGIAPRVGQTEKELLETAKASAPSGVVVPVRDDCPTCNGSGVLDDDKECLDCDGSGKDATKPSDKQLNTVNADGGSMQVGDSRETIDKSDGIVEKDGMISGPNPFLNGSVNSSTTDANAADDDDDGDAPGSPDWEANDAEIATSAANALLQAAELIRQFADREAIEVAAGEGNDVFDTWDAQMALDAVTAAVGVMATLAFHEGVAAQKGVATKSGKRLSTKSVSALAAARDHLTALLGDDDPAKSNDDDAEKSQEDVLDMTNEELTAFLDARDAAKAVDADVEKGKAATDEVAAVANAKDANKKSKAKKPKADVAALEDEAEQGDNDSASSPAVGAAKAEKAAAKKERKAARKAAKAARTPEEIEARNAVKAQKKELRKARRVEKQAAEDARIAAIVGETVEKATTAIVELKNELENVKKMAVPGGPTKVRTPDAAAKAARRDVVEAEINRLEIVAKNTQDNDIRKGNNERIKELRAELAEVK